MAPPLFPALLLIAASAFTIDATVAFLSPLTYHSSWKATYTTNSHLYLFGNLFGDDNKNDDQQGLQENELARFSNLFSPSTDITADNINIKFDSLSIMISEWSKLFIDGEDMNKKKMGLTTPVTVAPLPKLTSPTVSTTANGNDVEDYFGVQLLFQKSNIGESSTYQDKDEKKDVKEKADKEKEPKKEGGVEVRAEKLTNGNLQVIATRCDIEEGTMTKEMSEQTILESLRKAMGAWRKEQL